MRSTGMLAALGLAFFASGSAAEDFDGTTPLLCATTEVVECVEDAACTVIPRDSVGVPQFMHVDVAGKEMWDARLGPEMGRSVIARSEIIDGKLILQGTDPGLEEIRDGLGWTVTIDQADGSYILTAASVTAGYVLFGACMPSTTP